MPPDDNTITTALDSDTRLIPKGWKPGTVAPYFRRSYGMDLKRILDELKENQDVTIDCKPFGLQAKTMLLRLNQAFLWIIEFVDGPDAKYKCLREQIELAKESKFVVRIHWKNKVKHSIVVEKAIDQKKSFKWKAELEDYFESAQENEKHVIDGREYKLNEDDIAYITEGVALLENFHVIKATNEMVIILRNSTIKKS